MQSPKFPNNDGNEDTDICVYKANHLVLSNSEEHLFSTF